MSRLMVLGAGISQLPLIQTAKDLGLEVIVISRPGKYPGFRFADRVYDVDTTDLEGVLAIARKEAIDGICTTGTDVAVRAVGVVSDAMGLRGISEAAARLSSNKWEMKQAFSKHGVRTASYVRVSSKEEARAAFLSLNQPVVFKATDSGGSKGIVKVDRLEQTDYAFEQVMQATRQSFFIVEQFLEGIEFGAQAFVYEGNIQFVMPHGDFMFYGDAGVPIGHYVPYVLGDEVLQDIHHQLEASITALGLDNCAINADFMLVGKDVYVLEIGGRAGATCLPELVSTYYGCNYYEHIVLAALGRAPQFNRLGGTPCACELLIHDSNGTLAKQENENVEQEDIIQVNFDYGPGDPVRQFKVGTDRIGQIVVKGNTLEEALKLLQSVKRNIVVETAPLSGED
ncbi:ATP-grasp domain-containing protein [Paenibacillus daejeonensis]|uniref:ATP-grasp domain-containing protein n=1 Tax=Paenibacillus daejeonensis TaxID=135193 RepID=UPI00036172F7|nr:ATP-grasp domain-containing protein [Paenibacillus daejeonensis]